MGPPNDSMALEHGPDNVSLAQTWSEIPNFIKKHDVLNLPCSLYQMMLTSFQRFQSCSCLATLCVNFSHPEHPGKTFRGILIIDSASQRSYISNRLVEDLGLGPPWLIPHKAHLNTLKEGEAMEFNSMATVLVSNLYDLDSKSVACAADLLTTGHFQTNTTNKHAKTDTSFLLSGSVLEFISSGGVTSHSPPSQKSMFPQAFAKAAGEDPLLAQYGNACTEDGTDIDFTDL